MKLTPRIVLHIPGGVGAPRRARRTVLAQLDGQIGAETASDLGLIVSELITNSVLHAEIGPDQLLTVEIERMADRLRIMVTNPGAERQPRLQEFDPAAPGGFGLRLVEEICAAWGIVRGAMSTTAVWCELALAPAS